MSLNGAARFEFLSSGMKRRVLLARAIAAAPDLLLLDEAIKATDDSEDEMIRGWASRYLGRS